MGIQFYTLISLAKLSDNLTATHSVKMPLALAIEHKIIELLKQSLCPISPIGHPITVSPFAAKDSYTAEGEAQQT